MPANKTAIAGVVGVAFAIAMLVTSGLLAGGVGSIPVRSPAVQSVGQQEGANAPLYSTSSRSSPSNPGAIFGMSQSSPSPQAISSLTTSSVGSLLLLSAASLAISLGFMLFLSRRLK